MNKKAIEVKFLIGVIIALVGFAIVLLVYSQIGKGSMIDKKACHTSVVLKAAMPEPAGVEVVPVSLNCKTEKICITAKAIGRGNCGDELGKDFETLRVTNGQEKQQEEINKIISDKKYECWKMMGEGKLDVFGGEMTIKNSDMKCIICTRIAFDKDNFNKEQTINGLLKYQMSKKIPNSDKTYRQFLTNNYEPAYYTPDVSKIDFYYPTQKSIIFYELNPSTLDNVFGTAAGCLTGGVKSAGLGAGIGSIVPGVGSIGGGATGFLVGCLGGGIAGYEITSFIDKLGDKNAEGCLFNDYNKEELEKLKCTSFENLP